MWEPSEDGTILESDVGSEEGTDYVEWLEYLMEHFITRWGYTANGVVYWNGEDRDDRGVIIVEDSVVRTILGDTVGRADGELESVDATVNECNEYRKRLSAEMPTDFKDWHQNCSSEWPLLAAGTIRTLRESLLEVEKQHEALRATLEVMWASAKRSGRWLSTETTEECSKEDKAARWFPYTDEEQIGWFSVELVRLMEAALFCFNEVANSNLRLELNAKYDIDQDPA
jgi:hypothetical protein